MQIQHNSFKSRDSARSKSSSPSSEISFWEFSLATASPPAEDEQMVPKLLHNLRFSDNVALHPCGRCWWLRWLGVATSEPGLLNRKLRHLCGKQTIRTRMVIVLHYPHFVGVITTQKSFQQHTPDANGENTIAYAEMATIIWLF